MNAYEDFKIIETIFNASSRQLDLALNLKQCTLSNFGTTILYLLPSKENVNYLFRNICDTLNSQNAHYKAYKSSKEINYDGQTIIIRCISCFNKKDLTGRRFKKVYFLGGE